MGDRIEYVDRRRRHRRAVGTVLGAAIVSGALGWMTGWYAVSGLILLSGVIGGLVWFGLR